MKLLDGFVFERDRDDKRTLVRCALNKYQTPLFSFDSRGIWIRCKDCRSIDSATGETRRGAFHLTPWTSLIKMALGLVSEVEEFENANVTSGHDDAGRNPSSDHHDNEESTGANLSSPG